MIKSLVTIAALFILTSCSEGKADCQSFRTTVDEVFAETCTMRSENPKCRVELSNGVRVNVDAPILKGDILFGCTYASYTRLWRIETPSKIGLTTIGAYDN